MLLRKSIYLLFRNVKHINSNTINILLHLKYKAPDHKSVFNYMYITAKGFVGVQENIPKAELPV